MTRENVSAEQQQLIKTSVHEEITSEAVIIKQPRCINNPFNL